MLPRYTCFVLTLVDAFDMSLISHIQSFHTSKVSLVPIRSDMRGCIVLEIISHKILTREPYFHIFKFSETTRTLDGAT